MPLAALPVLALLCAALPVQAAGGGDQLPQFNPEHFPGQLFWLAISFTLFYLLLRHKALPRITAVQEHREKLHEDDLEAAAAANDEAQGLIAAYEHSLAQARTKARTELEAIIKAAQRDAAAAQQEQQKTLDAALHEAHARIDALRAQALAHLRENAADVAAASVAHLTGLQVNTHGAVDALHRRNAA